MAQNAPNPSGETHVKPIVLITGGGRGIGAATALLAARAGYAVAVNYRDQKTGISNGV